MKKLIFYDKKTTYMYPSGKIATPEVIAKDYEASQVFKFVIETDKNQEVIYGFYPFSSLKSKYNIDTSLSDDEILLAIEEIVNTPEEMVEAEPTAEERIAAALEYQNMASMEDVEVVE